jgi:hypothetical protein
VPAGQSGATVTVTIKGDTAFESAETLTLTLSNPTEATIGDGTGTGTIVNNDKATTTITLRVLRTSAKVTAKGILEPTQTGHRVTATLFRKVSGRFVKVAAKTVSVRFIKDREGDSKKDGSYVAAFARPKAAGTYKVQVVFKATGMYKGCTRSQTFTL